MKILYLLVILVVLFLIMKPSGYTSTPSIFTRKQINYLLAHLPANDPKYDCIKNSYGGFNINTALLGTAAPMSSAYFNQHYILKIPLVNPKPYDVDFVTCLSKARLLPPVK